MTDEGNYYLGVFGSLKHNILLMLNQMEANQEYSPIGIINYLEIIEKRIRDIKKKLNKRSRK